MRPMLPNDSIDFDKIHIHLNLKERLKYDFVVGHLHFYFTIKVYFQNINCYLRGFGWIIEAIRLTSHSKKIFYICIKIDSC